MSRFLEHYPSNIHRIQQLMSPTGTSGKYPIDRRAADDWVRRQNTSLRREAARDLLENTYYVTLQDIFNHVGTVVTKIYEDNDGFPESERIYLYVCSTQKSFYWIATIAMYHIRTHNLREPTDFLEVITDAAVEDSIVHGNPILVLDDIAFSGSQLSELLQKILDKHYNEPVLADMFGKISDAELTKTSAMRCSPYVLRWIQSYHGNFSKIPPTDIQRFLVQLSTVTPPRIVVGLVGVNSVSLQKLQNMYVCRSLSWIPYHTPFKVYSAQTYQTLLERVGHRRFFHILHFFSNQTGAQPNVSLYTDLKLSDMVSTFTRVLTYGPIPPKYYLGDVFSPDEDAEDNRHREMQRSFAQHITRTQLDEYYQDLVKRETADLGPPPTSLPQELIEFAPFVTVCKDQMDPALLTDIQETLSYQEFMIPDPPDRYLPIDAKQRDLINRVDAYRCPKRPDHLMT